MIPQVNEIRRNRFQVKRLQSLSQRFGLSASLDCSTIERELKNLEQSELRGFIQSASTDDIIRQAGYISRVMGS